MLILQNTLSFLSVHVSDADRVYNISIHGYLIRRSNEALCPLLPIVASSVVFFLASAVQPPLPGHTKKSFADK